MKEIYDLFWLAMVIYLEARNQVFKGKLAVGWVVVTRTIEEKRSVADVVFRAFQFSALNTKDPNRMLIDTAPFSAEWRECFEAASAAYFTLIPNPAPSANHYLNPKAVDKLPDWYSKNKIITVIDDHEFLRV